MMKVNYVMLVIDKKICRLLHSLLLFNFLTFKIGVLNVKRCKTFKLFCIKADTRKADEIHEYFLKMEKKV
jgi:hypothetical protein